MIRPLLLLFLTYPFVGSLPSTEQTLVTVTVNESIVFVGMDTVISIGVEVKKGYHVQANKVNDESLIPTTLEVNNVENMTITKQEFPLGKQFKLEGTDSFLNVFDGKFLIKLFLSPGKEMKLGKYTLGAKLRYQACDSRSCLFPRVIDFSIPIDVRTMK